MSGDSVLVLRAGEVEAALAGREEEVLRAVTDAYRAHRRHETSVPHSTFLRFPGDDVNRIIALPAYLGGEVELAGLKWVASFPGNVERGLPRASAVLILSSCETGRPVAIVDGTLISARRTAASAALAARELAGASRPESVGLLGTGPINFEVLRFLQAVVPGLRCVSVFDLDRDRAEAFAARAAGLGGDLRFTIATDLEGMLRDEALLSFATSAVRPHVEALDACPRGATILHVSLRDLAPAAILAADNVVDDPDHVCRAETSVHLAELRVGSRDFIRCTLGALLAGEAPAKADPGAVSVFSPFGLGILDLAVAALVLERAREDGAGTVIPDFLQAS